MPLTFARGIDEIVSDVPGLQGLTLLENYLDAALARVAQRPGWAGIEPHVATAGPNGGGAQPHWRQASIRADVMAATSEVERREEEAMEARLAERVDAEDG